MLAGCVSLLLDFGASAAAHNRKCAALVLRNLCFHSANKHRLLADGEGAGRVNSGPVGGE